MNANESGETFASTNDSDLEMKEENLPIQMSPQERFQSPIVNREDNSASWHHQPFNSRQSNLDLIRAVAIILVLIYHTTDFLNGVSRFWSEVFEVGSLGVDVFFVLSGFLIGRLYWQEQALFGSVRIPRFMARRLLRTVPPYLAALAISWLGVYLYRGEPFDLGYLLFLQNYYERLPYFIVSWSLCVEEHFYVVLPLLLMAVSKLSLRVKLALIAGCALLPAFFRMVTVPVSAIAGPLGWPQVATHLRCEGLIIGVLGSAVATYYPARVVLIATYFPSILAVASLSILAKALVPQVEYYRFGYLAVASCLGLAVVAGSEGRNLALRGNGMIRRIAEMSYSIYLTHAVVIHTSRQFCHRAGVTSDVLNWIASVIAIILAGAAFYACVERPSILLRDRICPRRCRSETVLQ